MSATLRCEEKFHFALQLVRIPKKNKLDLIRLLQVVYNIGQFYYDREINEYEGYENVLTIFSNNKMNNITTYTTSKITI